VAVTARTIDHHLQRRPNTSLLKFTNSVGAHPRLFPGHIIGLAGWEGFGLCGQLLARLGSARRCPGLSMTSTRPPFTWLGRLHVPETLCRGIGRHPRWKQQSTPTAYARGPEELLHWLLAESTIVASNSLPARLLTRQQVKRISTSKRISKRVRCRAHVPSEPLRQDVPQATSRLPLCQTVNLSQISFSTTKFEHTTWPKTSC